MTTDGKIKGTNSNELEITITPGEGMADFKGFPIAYIDYYPYNANCFDWAPIVPVSNISKYAPGQWLKFSEKDGKYFLTVESYPQAYEEGGGLRHTISAYMFVFPASVHSTFSGMGPNAGNDPSTPAWWGMNKAVFMAPDQYGNVSYLSVPRESYQKYVITLNVEQPAE